MPDLATRRTQLTFQQNAFRVQITSFEDEILAKLAAAQGDIIQNEELIEQLEQTKSLSNELMAKSEEITDTAADIHDFCEQYVCCPCERPARKARMCTKVPGTCRLVPRAAKATPWKKNARGFISRPLDA